MLVSFIASAQCHGDVHVLHVVCSMLTLSTRWSCERIAFQFSNICCSVLLDALASRSVMLCRREPTVSGEIDTFSVSTRNAEIRLVSCVVSIIVLLRKLFPQSYVEKDFKQKTRKAHRVGELFDVILFVINLLRLHDYIHYHRTCLLHILQNN